MKNLKLVIVGFLLITSVNFAQSNDTAKVEVEKMAKQMFVDMNNKDYDAILEMCHPKLFDMIPKEQFKSIFKSTLEGNEEFSIDIPKEIPAFELSEVHKEKSDSLQYAFVAYDMKMKMTFHKQTFDKESQKMMQSAMKLQGMEATFLSENAVDVNMKNRITILIKDDSTNNKWAMINYDSDSPFFFQLLPTSVIEKVKKYKEDLMLRKKKEEEK